MISSPSQIFLMVDMVGLLLGRAENIMHGRLGHSAEHGQVVQRYIPFPAEFPDTLLDRFR